MSRLPLSLQKITTMTGMKRILLSLMALVGALTMQADSYTYLTFETTDGSKVSVNITSLSLSVSGTTLTAGSQQFTLTNLSKMYFTSGDMTTGIEQLLLIAQGHQGRCEDGER
jgi:hypothetical protein